MAKRKPQWFKEKLFCKKEAKGRVIESDRDLLATVQLYHNDMALQDSLLQWYRALFMAFEAATFGLAYFLAAGWLLWIVFSAGVLGCIAWCIVCTQRTNLGEKQRKQLEKLTASSKSLKIWFEVYEGQDEWPRRLAQITFNLGLPIVIFALWILLRIGLITNG